jgi:uncharacterized membrane protein
MTFTYPLQNSGSISQTYALTTTGVPVGWDSALTPLTTTALDPGDTVPVTLTLTAPLGTPDNAEASVTITASCKENSCTAATAKANVRVGPAFGVKLGGTCGGPTLPGVTITCLHTVTNTGISADTFAILPVSSLGWGTAVSPPTMLIEAGATRPVTITVTVPTSAPAGATNNLFVTARSTTSPEVQDVITDITTVQQFARLDFSPREGSRSVQGLTITFKHMITNTGNGPDRFFLSYTQNRDWTVTITPSPTGLLGPGESTEVTVRVVAPPGTLTGEIDRVVIRATSEHSPSVNREVVDQASLTNITFPGNTFLNYLPLVMR